MDTTDSFRAGNRLEKPHDPQGWDREREEHYGKVKEGEYDGWRVGKRWSGGDCE